jgi:hypothetical protein
MTLMNNKEKLCADIVFCSSLGLKELTQAQIVLSVNRRLVTE